MTQRPSNRKITVRSNASEKLSAVPQMQLVNHIFARLGALNLDERELIYSHFVQGMKPAQIASERGVKQAVVSRSLVNLDKRMAKALLEQKVPGPDVTTRRAPVITQNDDGTISVSVTLEPGSTMAVDSNDEWNTEKDNRRCDLIDKDIDETITANEAVELELLQNQHRAWLRRTAPLPLEGTRRLYDELMQQAEGNRACEKPQQCSQKRGSVIDHQANLFKIERARSRRFALT